MTTEQKNELLIKTLNSIKKHIEITVKGAGLKSTVWVIADNGLKAARNG